MNHESLRRWHAQLLSGELRAVRALPGPLVEPDAERCTWLIFPGAFNPLHAGHRAMADAAQERLQRAVEFEISLVNVDKPAVAVDDLLRRVEQFPPHQPVWLTGAARFTEKADLFAGATFVVGIDTIARLCDPRYYGGDCAACDRAIEHIAARGCRFLVFGRAAGGEFQTLSRLPLPPALTMICDEVSESQFRHDISSTELRIARNTDEKY
jgi:hypothetical protein